MAHGGKCGHEGLQTVRSTVLLAALLLRARRKTRTITTRKGRRPKNRATREADWSEAKNVERKDDLDEIGRGV